MCKRPEPDTSPEARRAAETWFRDKRRETQRRTGRGWPPFTALPRAILRRLTPA